MTLAVTAPPVTGILILNYHQPQVTVQCVASFLAREPGTSRILWIENDAALTREALMASLAAAPFPWVEVDPDQGALPPPGTVGVILCPGNLGYAGGNNVGLRFLHRHGVPFGWVLNNDTLLTDGSSIQLVAAARARPEVGAWGTVIVTDHPPQYFGGIVQTRDFALRLATTPESLEDPLAFVSGCSLFMPMAIGAEVGFLPEDYFLYYEDPSFSLLLKRAGYRIGGLWTVTVRHQESLSTGSRSRSWNTTATATAGSSSSGSSPATWPGSGGGSPTPCRNTCSGASSWPSGSSGSRTGTTGGAGSAGPPGASPGRRAAEPQVHPEAILFGRRGLMNRILCPDKRRGQP